LPILRLTHLLLMFVLVGRTRVNAPIDLQLFTDWIIYKNASNEMAIYVSVPLLYADALYQGQHIGTGRVHPFAFAPISDAK
jgi:hypothetical protein